MNEQPPESEEQHDFSVSVGTMVKLTEIAQNRKSSGHDEITRELLKYGESELQNEMTTLFKSIV